MKFEKITHVRAPFDRTDPDPKKNYGIGQLSVWWILKGEKGATQFAASFPCYLPHVAERLKRDSLDYWERYCQEIRGFDVGFHSIAPVYEDWHKPMDCELFPGKKCYYDGSSLHADDWAKEIFSIRGKHPEEEIWRRLEEEYYARFGGGPDGGT